MRKLFYYAALFIIINSCNKESATPESSTATNPPTPVVTKPVTQVSVLINTVPMKISILNYDRGLNSLSIEAEDSLQKVELIVTNFYQPNPFNYICNYAISYATRPDSASTWVEYPVTNQNEELYFYDFQPMKDSIVKGYFSKTYELDKSKLVIYSDFKLVFK